MLPIVDRICSMPSAPMRAPFGSVSAISATASPNTPPTPRPVRNRNSGKVPIRAAEEREAGEAGVDQHREREHLRPAVAIAERPEDQPADAPADQKQRRHIFADACTSLGSPAVSRRRH